ncbi:helix-turn-helix transcriptional regulator [Variovorax sp. OV084]|uniref:helix-turn-helix domain-containing protein n=1 Tax=Variovorax sp. OV084 TaxID=1882777 RepID=UPI0015A69DB4|nr:helix-turn-helix transcriptional regulator [Variovorax sp. OV084]
MRLKAGLSQAQLAEKMGTQQSNISRWERDPGDLKGTTILKLAAALNVDGNAILKVISITDEVVGEA